MITWLGNSLASEGLDITFCSCYGSERADSFSPVAKSVALNIPNHSNFIIRNYRFFKCCYQKLKDIFEEKKYDYVVSFGETSYFVLLALRKKYGYKIVVSERLDPNISNGFFDTMRRKCYRYTDLLVCQSEGAKNCFNERIQKKTVVITNPISLPKERWQRELVGKTIATSGRLTIGQKRQDVLIKAFAMFHVSYPDYILNIYGDGPDKQKLESLSEENDIKDYIKFMGSVKDVQKRLLSDEVFVLTSDYEGVPNALLEAMALGMPVISTKCSPGGAEMLIDNENNGLLVECGDAEGLSKAMEKMVNNKEAADVMAVNARLSVMKYDPQSIIKQWLHIMK